MSLINFSMLAIILTILCIHHEDREKVKDIYIVEENVKCPDSVKRMGHFKCDKQYKVKK